ncbi:MAG: signal peptidase I [Candidatus Levybacteria bacterium]|nr:signal peptidase I [Candidatus Levybacteria bacterium]
MFKQLINYLFLISPIIKFQIKEKSMEPGIKEGSVVLINRYHYLFKKPEAGDMVVLRDPTDSKRFIIKRVKELKDGRVFVIGDNEKESVDSRQFGWIDKKNILGKVFFKISNS